MIVSSGCMLNLPKLICYFKDFFFISLRCIVLGLDYDVCTHTHTLVSI
jgi:hypothetical protein